MAASACRIYWCRSTLLSSLYGVAYINNDIRGLRSGTVVMAKTEHS